MGFCAPAAGPFSAARWASLLAFSAKEHLRRDGSLPDPDAGGGTGYLSASRGLSVSYGNMPHSDQTCTITARGPGLHSYQTDWGLTPTSPSPAARALQLWPPRPLGPVRAIRPQVCAQPRPEFA